MRCPDCGHHPDDYTPSDLASTLELAAVLWDLILDRVRSRKWSGGGSTTVVTADGELGRMSEAEGGKWLKVGHGSSAESVAGRIGGRFFK